MSAISYGTRSITRRIQLASTYSNHWIFRNFSSIGYGLAEDGTLKEPLTNFQKAMEARKAYMKQWRTDNAHSTREWQRQHYLNNKETLNAKAMAHRKKLAEQERLALAETIAAYENHKYLLTEAKAAYEVRKSRLPEGRPAYEAHKDLVAKARAAYQVHKRLLAEGRAKWRAQYKAERRAEKESPERARAYREANRQRSAEYFLSPENRAKRSARDKGRLAADYNFAQRKKMREWLLRSSQEEAFSWKTHFPVSYPQKVVKTCNTCGIPHYGGARLWWQSLANPDMYVCHTCHTADVSRAMPRGWEDFEFGHGKWPKP